MRAGRKARATGRAATARCDERLLANIAIVLLPFLNSAPLLFATITLASQVTASSSMAVLGGLEFAYVARGEGGCFFCWGSNPRPEGCFLCRKPVSRVCVGYVAFFYALEFLLFNARRAGDV
jgi:hypothetical protein